MPAEPRDDPGDRFRASDEDSNLDPQADPFKPPAIPTEVRCTHCGEEYDSYLIEWRVEVVDGQKLGFWCCPTPGCSGRGFGFDLFPTDPEYIGEDGEPLWYPDDEDEDDEEDDDGLNFDLSDDDEDWGIEAQGPDAPDGPPDQPIEPRRPDID